MRAALIVSIGINLFLVTGIGIARVDVSRNWFRPGSDSDESSGRVDTTWAASFAADQRSTTVPEAATSLADYYDYLRSLGLSHENTYLPLSGWVSAARTSRARPQWAYWLTAAPVTGPAQARLFANDDKLRADLSELYGPEVSMRPEFSSLFSPLGPSYDFMNVGDQIALIQWRERSAGTTAGMRQQLSPRSSAGPAAGTCRPGDPVFMQDQKPVVRASELPGGAYPPGFDADLRFEDALRHSPLAIPLRQLQLDEASYREAFRLLELLLGAQDLRERVAATDALKALLGTTRADEILMRFDPEAAHLERILASQHVAPQQSEAAYAVIARAREEILALLSSAADVRSWDTASRIAVIKKSERSGLDALLGPDIARQVAAELQGAAAARAADSQC